MIHNRNLCCLVASLALAQFLPAQFYGPRIDLDAGLNTTAVKIADMNGDGHPDLVATNFGEASATVFLGDGQGGFAAGTFADTGQFPASIILTDLNADGQPDMLAGSMLDTITARLGDGQGGFYSMQNLQAGGSFAISIAAGDLNLDGIPDLVTANHADNTVSVMLGDGSGEFGARNDIPVGLAPRAVVIGDLNGDDLPDLVTANQHASSVTVLYGDGAGSFMSESTFLTGNFPTAVAIGDLDGDGTPDLVTANSYVGAASSVSILLGDGSGGFAPKTDAAVGAQVQCVAIADINVDGIPDLVTVNGESGLSGSISMLFGDGLGGFGPKTDIAVGFLAYGLDVGDLNGDGKPDLVTANTNSNTVSVILNTSATPAGISSYGTGTPGCKGTLGINANSTPNVGNANFAVTITNAPPSSAGILMASNNKDALGSDPGYGFLMHVRFSRFRILPPIHSDASGLIHAPLPIPNIPSMVGSRFYLQGVAVSNPGQGDTCSPSPVGVQTTKGLEIIIQ